MRGVDERVADILKMIRKIDRYTNRGRETYDNDELVQVWIQHHLLLIGEALRFLRDTELRSEINIPWSDAIAMRNLLIHEYAIVDPEEVWNTALNDLPLVKSQLEAYVARRRDQ